MLFPNKLKAWKFNSPTIAGLLHQDGLALSSFPKLDGMILTDHCRMFPALPERVYQLNFKKPEESFSEETSVALYMA